jgi:predicted TIM-barrel fold metal-dependent hydrolase
MGRVMSTPQLAPIEHAPIFDADQHLYETAAALTRHLPERYRRDVQFVQVGRRTRIAILGRITEYIPNPTFDRVAAPGAHEKFYAGTNTEGKTLRELTGEPIESIPAFREPGPRLQALDAQGVAETFVFPTLANLVEHSAAEEPELVIAVIHALNRWMLEEWGYTYRDRLFMTPVVTLALVEEAQRELAYLLDNGARAILIKPAPVKGLHGWRSPASPEFDPFWRDVQTAGIPVVLHASQPPLTSYADRWEPPKTNNFMQQSALRYMLLGHREIADMIAALICQGTLTRFPQLRIASIENGSAWIRTLSEDLTGLHKKMPQAFDEDPIKVLRRNCWVSPFWEGSVGDVVEWLGWDKVMFGSDYPHPEGLPEPKDYYKYAEGMDHKRAHDFMGDNARRLLGLPIRNPHGDHAPAPA